MFYLLLLASSSTIVPGNDAPTYAYTYASMRIETGQGLLSRATSVLSGLLPVIDCHPVTEKWLIRPAPPDDKIQPSFHLRSGSGSGSGSGKLNWGFWPFAFDSLRHSSWTSNVNYCCWRVIISNFYLICDHKVTLYNTSGSDVDSSCRCDESYGRPPDFCSTVAATSWIQYQLWSRN